jgi:hypothetical protein
MTWREALAKPELNPDLRWEGEGKLVFSAKNRTASHITIEFPAGIVVQTAAAARIASICAASIELSPGTATETVIPAVALSAKSDRTSSRCRALSDPIPALQPLIEYSAAHTDLPRSTAQCATLILLEDISFKQWLDFRRAERPANDETVTAIDAIALATQLRPGGTFAMATDPELRLRALRNPLSRAKAMQIFGMTAPEGVPILQIDQLLHTKPGDNCPICRLRAQMGPAENGP